MGLRWRILGGFIDVRAGGGRVWGGGGAGGRGGQGKGKGKGKERGF